MSGHADRFGVASATRMLSATAVAQSAAFTLQVHHAPSRCPARPPPVQPTPSYQHLLPAHLVSDSACVEVSRHGPLPTYWNLPKAGHGVSITDRACRQLQAVAAAATCTSKFSPFTSLLQHLAGERLTGEARTAMMRRVCTATRLGRAAAVRCTPTGRRLITGMVIIAAAMAAGCVYQALGVWDK